MINNEELFFKYIHNKLDEDEKIKFEKELKNSSDLFTEFEDYKRVIDSMNKIKNIRLEENYVQQVLPKFRNKVEQKKVSFSKPVIGFALSVLLLIVSYVLITRSDLNKNETQILSANDISEEDFYNFIDDFELKISNSLSELQSNQIDSIYSENLAENINQYIDMDKSVNNLYLTDLTYSEIDDFFTSEDIEEIYSLLSEKRIY